jgi:hypothetical protein
MAIDYHCIFLKDIIKQIFKSYTACSLEVYTADTANDEVVNLTDNISG